MIPRATYRLQFHEGFTFADAEAIVPYLDRLGISHIYASPITVAAPGSTHFYDVADPTRISPALGGEERFRSLVAALRARDMGVILDIVPNHMGVAGGANPWWNDVLRAGRDSAYAATFDIDWDGPIVLPVLGAPLSEALANGDLAVERDGDRWSVVAYGEHRFPIRDEDQATAPDLPLPDLLARQHYRLAWWRVANDELNWRRFFTINDLAGVRIEDPAVFDATHALYIRLIGERLIDGVRVDHVDGLADPIGYCRTLRERLGDAAWILVEKILAPADPQPGADWGLDGTSGYDFMEQVSLLIHDRAGVDALERTWSRLTGESADFAPEEFVARQDLLAWQFAGQLDRCVAAFSAIAPDGITTAMLRRAIERLLWVFPVYRTYGTGQAAPASDETIRRVAREQVAPLIPPGETAVVDMVLDWLAGTGPHAVEAGDAVRRFQQLSAPIAAKAVEDTAFYRYGRLLSRNDVGADAELLGVHPDTFHDLTRQRATAVPHAMLTTATHDHKRGEDARARLAVLSAMPDAWAEQADRWMRRSADAPVHPADRYMLFQSLLGAWPEQGPDDEFAERIKAWQRKALREAKLRSSWEAPDEGYEADAAALVDTLLDDPAFVTEMGAMVARIAPAALDNTLVQLLLRMTLPGVPDCYQGTELIDLSLVDPDNRRPVDFTHRAGLLDGDELPPKMRLITDLLALRRAHPALFEQGDYAPAVATGPGVDHLLAFERRHGNETLRCAVRLHGYIAKPDDRFTFTNGAEVSAATILEDRAIWYDCINCNQA
ncbi:malto-oligosyltrehalose synthase [uncultured Sphingomonas sp.]|jgi:(1->4)-alpha-D-glucan 1-alpha-D-glucosylmutase|uniref:malto-oligosyltrehalose synthase n=1 Tax=uncultured Sphingomonas sp. TaxID=158754 RepID=UPI0030D9CC08